MSNPTRTNFDAMRDVLGKHAVEERDYHHDDDEQSSMISAMAAHFDLVRRSEQVEVPRNRIVIWWESIWFALFRYLATWIAKRASYNYGIDIDTLAFTDNLSGVQVQRAITVTQYTETQEEYEQRLRNLIIVKQPTEVTIPVLADRQAPLGTAFLMDPAPPLSVGGVILYEPADETDTA